MIIYKEQHCTSSWVLLAIDNSQRFLAHQQCHLRASIDLDMNIEEEISLKGITLYNFFSNKRLYMLLWVPLFCRLCSPMLHLEVSQFLNEMQSVCRTEHRTSQDILGSAAGVLATDYMKMDH